MRKVFICLAVILVLALSVAPAFAASSSEYIYRPIISFDTVSGSLGSEVGYPWPLNSAELRMYRSEFSLGDGLFTGEISSSDLSTGNFIDAAFDFPEVAASSGSTAVLTLRKDSPQVIARGRLEGSYEIYSNVNDLVISSVRLTGSVANVQEITDSVSGDELYRIKYYYFDRTYSCSDSVARIGDWLDECIDSITEINGQYYALLNAISVELTVYRTSVNTPRFYVSAQLSPNRLDINQWFYQYNLDCSKEIVVNNGDFDVVAWLSTAVGGFLSFQIFPGFSIDKIFNIFLVVGVLLWFFRVIS